MAALSSYESHQELLDFLHSLDNLFNQIRQSLTLIGLEHCKSKLERCIPIVSSILLCVPNDSQNESQQTQKARRLLLSGHLWRD